MRKKIACLFYCMCRLHVMFYDEHVHVLGYYMFICIAGLFHMECDPAYTSSILNTL